MSQDNHNTERRVARRWARHKVTAVTCLRGVMGLGPNLAVALLDVSTTGARLVLKEALPRGEEVELNLSCTGRMRDVKTQGEVMWSIPAEGGGHVTGVQFNRNLPHADLLDVAWVGT